MTRSIAPEPKHDAGGKVRLRLRANVTGEAVLSPCERYRPLLTRDWSDGQPTETILWIGMNPSTALENIDDPTVFKEQKFSDKWGFRKYVKCNVMDYRSTDQSALVRSDIEPCSDVNLATIIQAAKTAGRVMLAHGSLKPRTACYGDIVSLSLHALGIKMHALKLTQNGSPWHPLYVADNTVPIPYRPRALTEKELKAMAVNYQVERLKRNLRSSHISKQDTDRIMVAVAALYSTLP